jgi:hypothetical protein
MALGLFLVGGVGIANATPLLTNGTFDTDLSGWTVNASKGVRWISGTARIGRIGRPGTPGIAILQQEVDIPVGTNALSIGFDYEWQIKQPTVNQDFFTAEFIYQTTAGTTTITEVLLNEGSDSGSFGTTVSFNTVLSLANLASGSLNGAIRFTLDENNSRVGTRIQLDNVFVSAATGTGLVSTVPAPTPLALMVLGLAGIGYRQRRGRKAV